MKAAKLYFAVLLLIGCNRQEEPVVTDIFHQWQWIKTTRGTRGSPLTAGQSGTTFFYEFTKEGQLRILNNDGSFRTVRAFTLTQGEPPQTIHFPRDSAIWHYVISKDTLLT
jgi:hypothetical protein